MRAEPDIQQRVAWILRTRRTEQKLEQGAIAEAFGVAQSSWQRIETGRSSITIAQFVKACSILKLDPVAVLKSVTT